MFEKQDSIGLRPWSAYAAEAGVPDVSAFIQCAEATTTLARVERGLELGSRLGIRGTPTIIINRWLLQSAPYGNLATIVANIRADKNPFETQDVPQ